MLTRDSTIFATVARSTRAIAYVLHLLTMTGCAQLHQPLGSNITSLAAATNANPEVATPTQSDLKGDSTQSIALETDTGKAPGGDEGRGTTNQSGSLPLLIEGTTGLRAATKKIDDDRTVYGAIRSGWGLAPLPEDVQTQAKMVWTGRRDFVERSLLRARQILPVVVDEIRRRGLPTELALLPVLESGYQSHVVSTAGAVGPFQFMAGTGRDYGLHDSRLVKMRSDYVASTRAALDYLTRLRNMFGDWHLALAAYNSGEGNVSKAIDKNVRLGLPTTFASLSLPAETKAYVPGLLAIKNMVDNPQLFGLTLDDGVWSTIRQVRKVNLGGKDIDVALVSKWSGLRESDVLQLNPGVKGGMVVAAATPTLLLPMSAAHAFDEASAKYFGQRAKYSAHVVATGERLANLAKRFDTKVKTLREINGIAAHLEPTAGSTVLVTRSARSNRDISWEVATNARLETQRITNKSSVKKRVAAVRSEPAVKGARRLQRNAINQVSAAATSDQTPSEIATSSVVCYVKGAFKCS